MAPIRVLLIEDDPAYAGLIEVLLKEGAGTRFIPSLANNLSEAEQFLRKVPIDVVVTDLGLPDAQDLEAVQRLRAQMPYIPIVVLTGAPDEENMALQALQLGAQDYLSKDGLDGRTLARTLRHALERARAEAEVRRLNAELQKRVVVVQEYANQIADLYNNAACGFHSLDQQGKFVRVNDTELRWLGYSREDLLGKMTFRDMLTPESAKLFLHDFPTLQDTGKAQHLELDVVRKNGSVFPVIMVSTALRDADGRFVMSRSTMFDMTERRVAEANLRFQARILSQVGDAVIATDTDGRIIYWSNGAERIYGHRMVDALGRTPEDVLGASWLPRAEVEKSLQAKGTWSGEAAQKARDGKELTAQVSVSLLLDAEGRPSGRLAVARDVSETKRLQSAMIQAEKMAGMGQMTAGVAHELKSPMSVVLGYADLLAGLAAGHPDLPEEFAKHLGVIQKHLVRCAGLVNSILDFSRKDRPVEDLDLREVVSAAAGLSDAYALEKIVEIRKHLPPDAVPVRGHKNLLEQVVVNLLNNAVDAAGKGGSVTLRVGGQSKRGIPCAEIRVRDTGPGLPVEVLPKLFEPFFTTKDPGKGTGLGLWLTRQIVTEAGGVISCGNASDGGAEFVVTLPLAGAPALRTALTDNGGEGKKGGQPMRRSKEKPRVVVVDDEKDFRELLRTWLAPRYEVECLSGGQGLTDHLAALEPDILILDVHMPGVDGFTACQRVRKDPRFSFLPIVFLTASKEDVDFIKTMELGANSYLNKPITGRELDFRIREVLEAERGVALK